MDNGKIITTTDLSSGLDGSIHVIDRLLGRKRAERLARHLEYRWRPGGREVMRAGWWKRRLAWSRLPEAGGRYMALKIEDERAERLAQELARRTGESIEEAVATALEERLTRIEQPSRRKPDPQAVETLLARFRALPDLDSRSHEDILGYNEQGFF